MSDLRESLTFLILKALGKKELEKFHLEGVERLLLRTSSHGKANEFPDIIPHLRADIAPFLSEKGIRLIGVDVPSVDPLDDKELAAHHQLFKHGIHIFRKCRTRSCSRWRLRIQSHYHLPYQMQMEVQFEQLLDQYK